MSIFRPIGLACGDHGRSRPKQADPRPAPRLYLVTPRVADAAAFGAPLAAALAAGDVAAVLLRLAEADERTLINRAKELAPSRRPRTWRCCSTAMSIWSRAQAPTARI